MTGFQEREKRKAQVSGKSSCMVTLPKKWVKDMGLRQGHVLTFTRQSNSSLLITCESNDTERQTHQATLRVSERETCDSVFRKIVSLYMRGYDQIVVRALGGPFTSSQRNSIATQVKKKLVGTEIISSSNDSIVLQVLLGYSELSVGHALRRMLLITSEMFKDAIHMPEALNKDQANDMVQREEEVERFSIYVMRQLNSSIRNGSLPEAFSDPRDILGYIQVTSAMGKVAYSLSKIAKEIPANCQQMDERLFSKISTMGSFASELFNSALLSLFKRDAKSADEIIDMAQAFPRMQMDLDAALKEVPEFCSPRIVADLLRRTVECSTEIAEIALDITIEHSIMKQEEAEESAQQGDRPLPDQRKELIIFQ